MLYLTMAMNAEEKAIEFEKKINSVESKVSTILDLIQGNRLDKNDAGIVGKINAYDKRIAELEKWKDRLVYTVIGMGVPAGIGVVEILRKIISKN